MRGAALTIMLLVLLALQGGALGQAARQAAPRVALLIGNPVEPGSGGGFRTIGEQLGRLGFAVATVENANRARMADAIKAFTAKVSPGATALFLFRGAMLRIGQTNILMPADAHGASEADAREAGIDLNTVEDDLSKKGAAIKIIVVDAPRSGLVADRFSLAPAGPAALELHDGTLAIVNAAQEHPGAGSRQEPGPGEDDLFLDELLRQTAVANVTLEQAFAKTRIAVANASGRRQVPSVSSSLLNDFYIAQDVPAAPPPAAAPPKPESAPATAPEIRPQSVAVPGPGEIFKDCDTCPELVVVPAGEFTMGSTDSDFEKPAHRVAIAKPFAIGRHEVTFAEWDACAAAKACKGDVDDHGYGRGPQPVIDVSWDEAQGFVKWLSARTKQTYRLPSEAEWEYAARAGSRSAYPWGQSVGSAKANCEDCSPSPARKPLPVGSFRPNAFGLYDTAGNAAEFVEDCWNAGYKSAPADGAPWRAGQCQLRVLRGGDFANKAGAVRSAARFRYDHDVRYYTNGFRVVRVLP